jgi:hypothetical protein
MFLMSLCLTDEDLTRFGVPLTHTHCCVSPSTAARSALHRVCAEEPDVARAVADMLDLRHLDLVTHVRAHTSDDLAEDARHRAQNATGDTLVGWAWALATDERPEVAVLGQRLMAEVYVRGLQLLARAAPP